METGTNPGSSRCPKSLRIHRQQVVGPRWRMGKETRVAGEHSLYGGGEEPLRHRWEGKRLIRQVKEAEQSDWLETENTTKIYKKKKTLNIIILIIITMGEKMDVIQPKSWILPLSGAFAALMLVTDVIHSGYWPDARTGSIICFLVPLQRRFCPVCMCTHNTQYSSVHTVTT